MRLPGQAGGKEGQRMLKSITVFCGSSLDAPEKYALAAEEAGRVIASQGRKLIYGSSSMGLMGRVARGARNAGGYVIAVNVELFRDIPYKMETDEYMVESNMQTRKVKLIDLGEGCIALPGGLGTLDEVTEVLCLNQIGVTDKAVGLLNVDGYFDGFLLQLRRAVQDRLMPQADLDRLQVADNIEELLQKMDAMKS